MNHYCTYFDRGFLAQGLALWRSLARHDQDAVLWVLALDDFTAEVLREVGGTWMRVVPLAELEAGDAELAAAKANRSRVEYFFTLSPCWPRWLLRRRPEIGRVTYVDADLFFFGDPGAVLDAMDAAGASVLVTPHRFPAWMRHYEQHGKFNVGILSWRNDEAGRGCLEDWRARCLEWCHDRLEDGKFADQRYLDAWPERWGKALFVVAHPGVNAAPWNWMAGKWEVGRGDEKRGGGTVSPSAEVTVDGEALVAFHFARFRAVRGTRWWESGQREYGTMPRRLRDAIYTPYWRALVAARDEVAARRAGFDFAPRAVRHGRSWWREWPMAAVFGGTWLRAGDRFFNLRGGLGRWSGWVRAMGRRVVGEE